MSWRQTAEASRTDPAHRATGGLTRGILSSGTCGEAWTYLETLPVLDLSRQGARVLSPRTRQIGATSPARLVLPDFVAEFLICVRTLAAGRAEGRTGALPHVLGLEFVDVAPAAVAEIDRFLSPYCPQEQAERFDEAPPEARRRSRREARDPAMLPPRRRPAPGPPIKDRLTFFC